MQWLANEPLPPNVRLVSVCLTSLHLMNVPGGTKVSSPLAPHPPWFMPPYSPAQVAHTHTSILRDITML
mgnify:CR=1 FL=1